MYGFSSFHDLHRNSKKKLLDAINQQDESWQLDTGRAKLAIADEYFNKIITLIDTTKINYDIMTEVKRLAMEGKHLIQDVE